MAGQLYALVSVQGSGIWGVDRVLIGLGFMVQGLGCVFRVEGLGFRGKGSGFGVYD